jgi:signal transduction histidine kinase
LLAQREEALPSEARAQLEVVHGNGLRLLQLVTTLLDFSRLEVSRVQGPGPPPEAESGSNILAG